MKTLIAMIDTEIKRLQDVRALLTSTPAKRAKTPQAAHKTAKPKRNLTPEGRKRIADAVKRRWAKQKAGKKAA